MTHRPTVGVVGTLVWDRIVDRPGRTEPVEEWGGVAYALGALRAALPEDWWILPLLKVGRDLAEEAFRFLAEMPGIDTSAVIVVPEPNNRVELRYVSDARRTERLTGGVRPWSWPELAPPLELCDALYVNFISGFEMTLETARAVRTGYEGPMYADLHSLFLGVSPRGQRIPQTLPEWSHWLACFDAVQMNEDEFELLAHATGDPWHLAAGVLGADLKLIAVTLGERGAAYVHAADFDADPHAWRAPSGLASAAAARSGKVPVEGLPRSGDPTGCGDVWGATLFARLMTGDGLEDAIARANRVAGRNVEHRGARGLVRHLSGRLSHAERVP